MFYFLIDENHTQIVSPGKKKLIQPHVRSNKWMEWKQLLLYLYLCILEGKKLELDFTNLFDHG